jgi:hypothetical protein
MPTAPDVQQLIELPPIQRPFCKLKSNFKRPAKSILLVKYEEK